VFHKTVSDKSIAPVPANNVDVEYRSHTMEGKNELCGSAVCGTGKAEKGERILAGSCLARFT
jgi:hypothetical protein